MWRAFYFRRKTTPGLSDSGLADIVLGGKELTASTRLHQQVIRRILRQRR